ncbi:TetR/AcrR family transcriptional regulator [Oceanicella actignis]|uniref:Transcriptional regulator, TetR family n=1 Tax=Oceanicella actignis TaxID=1189325 RepID=A0A1M7T1F7_9RHOB|nr:TetR/AcrR family transcriptional regulator [Oceanicella actignis]SET37615.1 transcriptional regulator, TetR family [Oceanicella actignis]SHN64502.1 transcriptional regulator, TetR family [Oceanicella actignis]
MTTPTPGTAAAPAPESAADRVAAARARILSAVVACLDELGYADTSIAKVQARAGVSRGALTHHFPSKEDLMAAAAERLLDAALEPARRRDPRPAREQIIDAWRRIVNTPEGRAFVEILVAARTDAALGARILPRLAAWEARVGAAVAQIFRTPEGDAARVWAICRTFLRGLVIHERFVADPAELNAMVARFADIVAPHLQPAAPEEAP